MQRCGFAAKGLFVMDGSRRSAHANAYFTGFGAAKRVVFFDTLLQRLSPGEVEAVLAHELGHFKHRHVHKRIAGDLRAQPGWASRCWAGCRGQSLVLRRPGRAAQPGARRTTRWRCCCSCWRCRCSASSSRRCSRSSRAATSSRPTPTPARRPAAHDLATALLKLHEDNAVDADARPGVRALLLFAPAGVRAAGRAGAAHTLSAA